MTEIKQVSADSADALFLMEKLSTQLEQITGNSGANSFSIEKMNAEKSVFLVAYEDNNPVGCGGIYEFAENIGEIKRVYSNLPGKGIGSSIVFALEEAARTIGYKELVLETRKINTNAVNFYLKNKYVICESYGKYIGREEAICFRKSL